MRIIDLVCAKGDSYGDLLVNIFWSLSECLCVRRCNFGFRGYWSNITILTESYIIIYKIEYIENLKLTSMFSQHVFMYSALL